jgi:hypothetical protein
VLSRLYGAANARHAPLDPNRPHPSKAIVITPSFVLRRLSHLPYHSGMR